MIIGTICAMAHGVALPALVIVFGDMTDNFVVACQNMSLVLISVNFYSSTQNLALEIESL
jgi:hypothetical protein